MVTFGHLAEEPSVVLATDQENPGRNNVTEKTF